MKKLVIGAVAALIATISLATAADAGPRWVHGGWNHGWRHAGWHRGYWGGPRIVVAAGPDYCYVKKIRRVDNHGRVYVKNVRVCG